MPIGLEGGEIAVVMDRPALYVLLTGYRCIGFLLSSQVQQYSTAVVHAVVTGTKKEEEQNKSRVCRGIVHRLQFTPLRTLTYGMLLYLHDPT